jgi:hypothetical protein
VIYGGIIHLEYTIIIYLTTLAIDTVREISGDHLDKSPPSPAGQLGFCGCLALLVHRQLIALATLPEQL